MKILLTISLVFIVQVYDKSQWTHLHQVIYYNASYTQIMSTQDYASYNHMRDMCSSYRSWQGVYIVCLSCNSQPPVLLDLRSKWGPPSLQHLTNIMAEPLLQINTFPT